MNEIKMRLANDEEIAIDAFNLPLHVLVDCPSKAEGLAIWAKLTPENLETVTILEGDQTTATFANVTLVTAQFQVYDAGGVTAHFFMTGENRSSASENDYVRAAKILLGEEE